MNLLRNDYSLIPSFIDEVMRFDAPVQCLYRIVTEDTFIGETEIPEGSNIMLGWGTAGRDPKYFDNPNKFDLYRYNADKNVGFGFGRSFVSGIGSPKEWQRLHFKKFLLA